eukprot:scaffold657047_cov57-Prasinocladus_malaysianus.AAC.1
MVQAVAWGPDSSRLAAGAGSSVRVSSLLNMCSMLRAVDSVPVLNWTLSPAELFNNFVPSTILDFDESSMEDLCAN